MIVDSTPKSASGFNPRPSVRGDQIKEMLLRDIAVSIHAPL